MPASKTTSCADLKKIVLEILDENKVMTVATVRPDGWPQATVVGYVRDDLTLYFAVAQVSQKLKNIVADPRISIALGHHAGGGLRGLSMAARVRQVIDHAEIKRLNAIMRDRYPGQSRLSPREASAAVLRADPFFVSVIDLPEGPGEPELARVTADGAVHGSVDDSTQSHKDMHRPAHDGSVHVTYLGSGADIYRLGAPF